MTKLVFRGPTPQRMVRGGSWHSAQDSTRCAYRGWSLPYGRADHLGFRVMLRVPPDLPRVVRGGSWLLIPAASRCASRFAGPPGLRDLDFGFRVVLRISPNQPQ